MRAKEKIVRDIDDKNLQLATLNKANKANGNAEDSKVDKDQFDINKALANLNSIVERIYKLVQNKSQDEDLSGKTALDMLTEIETRAMLDVESLTEHAKAEPKVLNNFENDQRNLYLAQKQNLTKERNDRILL